MANYYFDLVRSLAPLSPENRSRVGMVLGLGRHDWLVRETFGGIEIDRFTIPASYRSHQPPSEGEIEVEITGGSLPLFATPASLPLSAHILPYPFSLMSTITQKQASTKIKILCEESSTVLRLEEVLAVVEQLSHSVEFLWTRLVANCAQIDLVTQSVRGRYVKLGIVRDPEPSIANILNESANRPVRLDRYLGTRSAFLPLRLDPQPGEECSDLFERLVVSGASELVHTHQ